MRTDKMLDYINVWRGIQDDANNQGMPEVETEEYLITLEKGLSQEELSRAKEICSRIKPCVNCGQMLSQVGRGTDGNLNVSSICSDKCLYQYLPLDEDPFDRQLNDDLDRAACEREVEEY